MQKGQVWVETVIYILIAIALMTAVLAFVKPKINEMQDKVLLDQTIEALGSLDSQILAVWQNSPGNTRTPEIKIKKGSLIIDATHDQIYFLLDESRYKYSEVGETVRVGNINITTSKKQRFYEVKMLLDYSNFDLTYDGQQIQKAITRSPSFYKLLIQNKGKQPSESRVTIDISIIS